MDKNKLDYKFYVSSEKIGVNEKLEEIPESFIKYKKIHMLSMRDIEYEIGNINKFLYFYGVDKRKNIIKLCITIYYNNLHDNFDYFLKKRLLKMYYHFDDEQKEIIKYFLEKYFYNNLDIDLYMNDSNIENNNLGDLINNYYNMLNDDDKDKFLKYIYTKISKSKIDNSDKRSILLLIRKIKNNEKGKVKKK